MAMTTQEKQIIREQFMAMNRRLDEMQNAVTWLSLSVIAQNKLTRHLLLETSNEEEPEEKEKESHDLEEQALTAAGKDLAKMHAAMRHSMNTDDMWSSRFGVNPDWGQRRAK